MWGHNVGSPWQGTAGNKVRFWGTPCEGRGVWSLMNPGSSLGSISPPAGETSGPQFPHLLIRTVPVPPLLMGLPGVGRGSVKSALQSMPRLQNIFKCPDDKSQVFTCTASCNLPNSLKMIPISQLRKLRQRGVSQPGPGQQGLGCRGRAQTWEHLVWSVLKTLWKAAPAGPGHAVSSSEAWESRAPGRGQQDSVWASPK